MKMSEVIGQIVPPAPVPLPFRPGSEYRGSLPTWPPDKGATSTVDTVPDQYGGQVSAGPDGLRLEVLERYRELVLILKSPNPAWADRAVWVAVDGDGDEVVTAKLTLRRGSDANCIAEVNLGAVADLTAKLGRDLRWTVYPPRELPGRPKLRRSRPRRPWGHRHVLAAVVSLAVAASVMVLVYLQRPTPNHFEAAPSDSVAANPEAHISPKSQRLTMSGIEFILRKGDQVPFEASHPNPLKYQWLLHIANSAKLVASASKPEKLSYTLRQLDSDWGGADSRYEFLVIVTADKVLPGWPENVASPVELKGMFTRDELSELQIAALDPDVEMRDKNLKGVMRTALDRLFGVNNCWLQIFIYPSENRE